MPGQPQASPDRSQPARRPRREAGSQGGPGEGRRRDVTRPLPDPVAIRLCRVPDTAPPYDDEAPGEPESGPGRADALAAAIVAALEAGDRPRHAVRASAEGPPAAAGRRGQPRRLGAPGRASTAGPTGTARQPVPAAARCAPGSPASSRQPGAPGRPVPRAGWRRQAITPACGLAQQVRAGAGGDARGIPAASPASAVDDRTRPVAHTQARAAALGRSAAAGPAGHHLGALGRCRGDVRGGGLRAQGASARRQAGADAGAASDRRPCRPPGTMAVHRRGGRLGTPGPVSGKRVASGPPGQPNPGIAYPRPECRQSPASGAAVARVAVAALELAPGAARAQVIAAYAGEVGAATGFGVTLDARSAVHRGCGVFQLGWPALAAHRVLAGQPGRDGLARLGAPWLP